MGGGGGGDDQVTQTQAQLTQDQINANLWNYYETSYKPIIDKYATQTQDAGEQTAQASQVAGDINAEVMKNVNPAGATNNPVANAKKLDTLASTATGAQVQGQGGIRSKLLSDTGNVVGIGRGQATTATAGIGELAGQSVQAEISNMQIQQQEQGAIENAYGSVAGAVGAGLLKASSPNTKGRTLLPTTAGGDVANPNPTFAADPALQGADLELW